MTRYADPVVRSRAGAAGRAAAEKHSWLHMAEQYLAIFEELHASKQSGAAVAPR